MTLCDEQLARWAGVAVTILAVLVALFKDDLRRLWFRPRLTVRLGQGPPDSHRTIEARIDERTGALIPMRLVNYYHLWVENTGNESARNVQVFAVSLAVLRGEGFQPIPQFVPMNLGWAFLRRPDGRPEVFLDWLAPRMGRHCDVGHVVDPRPDDRSVAPFILDTETTPTTLVNHLEPGTYRLTLRIGAANCQPLERSFAINHTGRWFDDESEMIRQGTSITLL